MRTWVVACVVAAAVVLIGPAALAAAPEAGPPFVVKQVAPGVYVALDQDTRAGSNAGFVIGDDGVAVIDAFQYPEVAEKLLAEIRKLTPLPLRYVINTHHHIDHVAGDSVFRKAGAVLIAQRNVAGWIRTENLTFFGPEKTKERAFVEGLPLPDLLVDGALTIRLGNRRLELRALPGHTGGDLVIAVPDARVLFCGDLVWRRTAPSLIDATVSRWIETLGGLQHRPGASGYAYVPGQGDVATLADVADYQRYLEELTATVRTAMAAGAKGDELAAAVLPQLKARYGSWVLFDDHAPKEIASMAAELSGSKRVPPAQPGPEW